MEVHPSITGLQTYRRLQRDHSKLCEQGMKVVKAAQVLKALHSTGSGVGDEWVPTEHSPTLQDAVRLLARVAPLFRLLNMPTDPFVLPVRGTLPEAVLLGESTSDTPASNLVTVANPVTANKTLDTRKIGFRVPFATELVEDSIIAILPWLRDEMRQVMAHSLDAGILDGDTAGTHQDNDTHTAANTSINVRRGWEGLRKLATTKSDASGGLTLANIRSLRGSMGKYAATPSGLALITSVAGYMKLLGLGQVETLEKYGPQATVLTGELGRIDGIPIIVSEDYKQNLATSGVNTVGGPNTFTSLVVANTRSFVVGQRRGVTIRSFSDPIGEQEQLVVTARWEFESYFDTTTQKVVGQVHGIAI